jgi:hypothetical protein
MAGPLDFTGQNIEDSYQRVLQTDGVSITDGTGSYAQVLQTDGTYILDSTGSPINLQLIGSLDGTATSAVNATNASTASFVTASNVYGPNGANSVATASFVVIGQGDGITVSGMTVSAKLRTVNGNIPDPITGNVAVSLAAVLTDTSASLASYATGGLAEGTVWIVSGDATPENNGDTYVYKSGSVGQWLAIAPLDQTSGDARYARIDETAIQNLTSSFATTASFAISSSLSVSSSFATSASFARTAATASIQVLDEGTLRTNTPTSINFVGDGVTTTNTGTSVTVTIPGGGSGGGGWPYYGNAVISGSLAVTGSVSNVGRIYNEGIYQVGPWFPANGVNIAVSSSTEHNPQIITINGVQWVWFRDTITTLPPNTADRIHIRNRAGAQNLVGDFSASFEASKSYVDYVSRIGHLTIVSKSAYTAGTNSPTDNEAGGGGLFFQSSDSSRYTSDYFIRSLTPATYSLASIQPVRVFNAIQLSGSLIVSASGRADTIRLIAPTQITGSLRLSGSLNGLTITSNPNNVVLANTASAGIISIVNNTVITGSLTVSSSINGLQITTGGGRTLMSSSVSLISIPHNTTITGSLIVSGAASTINGLTVNPTRNSTNVIVLGVAATVGGGSGVNTIAIGSASLQNIGVNQYDMLAIGHSALRTAQYGPNTAIGNNALEFTTALNYGNTAVGYAAGQYSAAGNSILFGTYTGRYSLGSSNTFIGYNAALYYTGSNSVMIGGGAGRLAGTVLDGGYFADFNVVVGAQAYSGDSVAPRPAGGRYNFALGYRAMGLGAIGTGNSAIGTQTLLNLATGSNNTAIGYDSGNGLLIGSSNVFIGYRTAGNTKYGNGLIAIGDAAAYSLYNNVASSGVSVNSIAIGSNALYGRTTNTSISNIAILGSSLN